MRGGVAPIAIVVGLIAVVSGWIVRPSEQADSVATIEAPNARLSGCAKEVVDDFLVDGEVDRVYRPRCYDDALAALPRGPLDETDDALQAIRRARDDAAVRP